jgi:hypothetical protein
VQRRVNLRNGFFTSQGLYAKESAARICLRFGAPWQENGEVWRPLKTTYPDSIASHTREQVAYYGRDGLLRRHAYTVDVLGDTPGLNYAHDYRDVNGIIVPITRRVYPPDINE